jgi:hypothetical protein
MWRWTMTADRVSYRRNKMAHEQILRARWRKPDALAFGVRCNGLY